MLEGGWVIAMIKYSKNSNLTVFKRSPVCKFTTGCHLLCLATGRKPLQNNRNSITWKWGAESWQEDCLFLQKQARKRTQSMFSAILVKVLWFSKYSTHFSLYGLQVINKLEHGEFFCSHVLFKTEEVIIAKDIGFLKLLSSKKDNLLILLQHFKIARGVCM